jgi:hypothetical protein
MTATNAEATGTAVAAAAAACTCSWCRSEVVEETARTSIGRTANVVDASADVRCDSSSAAAFART